MLDSKISGRKGQVAFEFLVIYTVFMVVFIATVYVSSQRAMYQQLYAEQIYAREIGMRFAQEINTAARFPGYEKLYVFSDTIRGTAYSLNISDGTLILSYRDRGIFYYPLIIKNITIDGHDTFQSSWGIDTSKGYMLIKNTKGKIEIKQE
ncbi:MAG: hypothetical protein QW112_00695 [Candidatus Micrarchaeia archaeon]